MRAAAASDIGLVRSRNEDTVRVDAGSGIFILADGMGGPPGGDVASGLAVEASYRLLSERLPVATPDEIPRLMTEALAAARGAVVGREQQEPHLAGMGTTLDMAVVRGGELHLCHVGDSRVYLFRSGMLEQLTRDDNYAAWLVEHERLPQELVPPDARHMLTQTVGSGAKPVPQLRTLHLSGDELIILCSDGLHGMIADDDIRAILHRHPRDPDRIAALLVAAALDAGGLDNVTVIVVEP